MPSIIEERAKLFGYWLGMGFTFGMALLFIYWSGYRVLTKELFWFGTGTYFLGFVVNEIIAGKILKSRGKKNPSQFSDVYKSLERKEE